MICWESGVKIQVQKDFNNYWFFVARASLFLGSSFKIFSKYFDAPSLFPIVIYLEAIRFKTGKFEESPPIAF